MTTQRRAALSELDAARDAAIDISGWGRRFVLYQPRNLAFWAYAFLVAGGLITFTSFVGSAPNATATTVAVVLFVLYGAVFWWFTQRADRYAQLPIKLMVVALLWGAFGAAWMMAAPANDAIGDLYAKTFGQAWALNWGAGLSAPLTEELAKGSGLLLLIAMAPRIIRTAFDGFILGLLIGLGFQITEDVSYALNSSGGHFGVDPVGSALGTIWLRMVTGVAGHFLYTAIFCTGLIYVLGRPAEPRRLRRGLVLMAIAPLLHGIWDGGLAIVGGNALLVLALWAAEIAIALIIFAHVFRLTVARERDLMRTLMAPEVARGVITKAELDAIAGDRKTRKSYRKAAATPRDRRTAGYVLDAVDDLAAALARSRGTKTGEVRFACAEIDRIRRRQPPHW